MPAYHEAIGCFHVHFSLSGGQHALQYLGQEASRAKLDFLVTSSHTPRHQREKKEALFKESGWYGQTLILVGEEIDDNFHKDSHCLVIGLNHWAGRKLPFPETIQQVKKEGGLVFIAHPDGQHRLFFRKADHRWKRFDITEYDGIEVWSLLFDWACFTSPFNLPARYLGFPANLTGPSRETLSFWDRRAEERPAVGVAGLDIHPLSWPALDVGRRFRYRNVFQVLRNHLLLPEPLTGNVETDRCLVLKTLSSGRLFFARDKLKDSRGFFFGSEDGKILPGDNAALGTRVIAISPFPAYLRLVGNGKILREKQGIELKCCLDKPGAYRIEVFLNNQHWIFSNHLYVREGRKC